jgi:hypothetical protein
MWREREGKLEDEPVVEVAAEVAGERRLKDKLEGKLTKRKVLGRHGKLDVFFEKKQVEVQSM